MINIDDLAKEISTILDGYSQDITDGIKKTVDTVTKEVNKEIKDNIVFTERSGKYIKAFRTKTSFEDRYNKRKTWYVANGQHRLAHLLEKGHALKKGGRAKAFPHIKYGEDLAQKRMVELSKEVIENAGR